MRQKGGRQQRERSKGIEEYTCKSRQLLCCCHWHNKGSLSYQFMTVELK
uniref:Uncharacterized protein n=1 Tax=Manihot esculenta TaxID=3983 RepID=A0A199U9Y2_MANES